MRCINLLMITLLLIAFSVTAAIAIEGGNPTKGKHLFEQDCAKCHADGGKNGEIKGYQKTMRQWDRFFRKAKRKHPGTIFKEISKKDQKDINQFFFDTAADAPSEETCG